MLQRSRHRYYKIGAIKCNRSEETPCKIGIGLIVGFFIYKTYIFIHLVFSFSSLFPFFGLWQSGSLGCLFLELSHVVTHSKLKECKL